MKKTFFAVFLLAAVFVFVATPVLAAQIEQGDSYNLSRSQTINDNLYVFGGNASIGGQVNGDLVTFGGTIVISGDVQKDLAVAGGNITLSGNVGDDLRMAGGNIMLTGKISGEALLAGGQINITEDVSINKDLLIGGGAIVIDGEVNGKATIGGDTVLINGRFRGPVRIYAQKITISRDAVLEQGLIYDAPAEAQIEQGAQISGDVVFNKVAARGARVSRANIFWPLFSVFWLIKLAMTLVAGLVLFALFGRQVRDLAKTGLKQYGWNLLRGFVLIILLPISAIILFVTVLGIPLGIILVLLTCLVSILASVLAGIMLGSWMFKVFKKTVDYEVTWLSLVLGIIVFGLLAAIPFVGRIIALIGFLMALGAIFSAAYQGVKKIRG